MKKKKDKQKGPKEGKPVVMVVVGTSEDHAKIKANPEIEEITRGEFEVLRK